MISKRNEKRWKKARLSEKDLNDALKQNENSEEESLTHQSVRRKWTLLELICLIESQGYSETDISKFYNQRRHEKWMKLVSSDWFSIFPTYLDIKDILRLDSAFCNHKSRIEWLILLKTLKPSISVDNNRFADKECASCRIVIKICSLQCCNFRRLCFQTNKKWFQIEEI